MCYRLSGSGMPEMADPVNRHNREVRGLSCERSLLEHHARGGHLLCHRRVGGGRQESYLPPPPDAPGPLTLDGPPVANWEMFVDRGHRIGTTAPKATIVNFSDFECPFCRGFSERLLPQLLERYPRDVAVIYRHFPLPSHRLAGGLANAAECAGEQGRFREFHDVVYAAQDSLGQISVAALAERAGIPDQARFGTCADEGRYDADVQQDVAAALELKVTGTPTFLINGKLLRGLIPDTTFLRLVGEEIVRSEG